MDLSRPSFNAGVLLLNLECWRRTRTAEQVCCTCSPLRPCTRAPVRPCARAWLADPRKTTNRRTRLV